MSDPNTITQAGDYQLELAEIISYRLHGGESKPYRMDIKNIIMSLELTEDIFNATMFGVITVYDTQDVRTVLPITGLEKLNLKFSTPGVPGIRATEEEGFPFQIHRIDEVRVDENNPKGQLYTIHFCSMEAYSNSLNRVSKAFSDTLESNTYDLLRNINYINSRKPFYFEPSKTNTKVVIPNLRPFQAIRQMAKSTQSRWHNNAGYLFYETPKGFFLRSIESMLAMGGAVARPEKAHYKYQVSNVRPQGPDVRPVRFDMRSVIKYDFSDPVNTLKSLQSGAYASKLITHDAFYKKLVEYDYNYRKDFKNHYHTEHADGNRSEDKHTIPLAIWENTNKEFGDFSDSKVMVKSETSKKHNEYDSPDPAANFNLQHNISQTMAMRNRNLNLLIPGNSTLEAGDIIRFDIPMMIPLGHDKKQEMNPYDSGRYLITRIKHVIVPASGRYEQVLNCYKDAVQTPYPKEYDTNITQVGNVNKLYDIYEQDNLILMENLQEDI
mgnify:CR=1 FL=1